MANQEKQTGDQPAPTQKLGQPVQIEGRSPDITLISSALSQ